MRFKLPCDFLYKKHLPSLTFSTSSETRVLTNQDIFQFVLDLDGMEALDALLERDGRNYGTAQSMHDVS
jgi:hypothetical protein